MKSLLDTISEARADNRNNTTEYVITSCDCTIVEDNYEEGELSKTEKFINWPVDIRENSLEGLMRRFNDNELNGHKFNMEDWVYDQSQPNRLELAVTGSLVTDYASFYEPSKKEWDDFKAGKTNLSAFVFDMYIEKHEVVTNLVDEFKKLKIESF